MKSTSPESSAHSMRLRRAVALTGVMLVAIGLALFAVVMDRGDNSVRFKSLREGMTVNEARAVIKPGSWTRLGPPPETGLSPVQEIVTFSFRENAMVPEFVATLTFCDGRLEDKQLQKPSLRQILAYWWS